MVVEIFKRLGHCLEGKLVRISYKRGGGGVKEVHWSKFIGNEVSNEPKVGRRSIGKVL